MKREAKNKSLDFDEIKAKAIAEKSLIHEWAEKLAQSIPRINFGRKPVKTYIVISRSSNYDGKLGIKIAREIAKIRDDIRFWGDSDVEFPIKQTGSKLRVIVPRRAAWQSKYFSTTIDRLVGDAEMQSAKPLPDLWVVGCSASSLIRPKGNTRRPIISIPGLHVLEEISTSENATGVRILEMYENGKFKVETYDFKDLASRERREHIHIPNKVGEVERKIISALKSGPMTIGMLSDSTGISRERIYSAIERIKNAPEVPNIVYSRESGKYDIDNQWIQENARYQFPDNKDVKEDSFVAFGCLHAGSVNTDYRFFVDYLPQIILDWKAKFLIGAGDFIEGLEHNLIEKGEVYGGMDYTEQEKLAAKLVAKVIMEVFRKRFQYRKSVSSAVKNALLTFVYTEGNHDAFVEKHGVKPLVKFRDDLINLLADAIEIELAKRGLFVYGLRKIISSKIICISYISENKQLTYKLPSSGVIHPRMPRTKTSSQRAQEALQQHQQCQVVFMANFHVAIMIKQWEEFLGKRIAVQVGTLVRGTRYEYEKLKNVDFGVACLKIRSYNGRIIFTESSFEGEVTKEPFLSNNDITKSLVRRFIGSDNI